MNNKIKGVFFDCDGVIADTEPIHLKSWQRVFSGRGIHLSDEYLDSWIGHSDLSLCQTVIKERGIKEDPETVLAEKHSVFKKMALANLPSPKGAEEFIRQITALYQTAVVSSSALPTVRFILDAKGLSECFSTIVGREAVQSIKPHPEPYLLAAKLSDVDPVSCWTIEDSPMGATSARGAGMKVVGITSSFTAAELTQSCEVVIEDFTDTRLVELFGLNGPIG